MKDIPRTLAGILEQIPRRMFHHSPDPPCTDDRSDGWDRRRGLDEPHLTISVAGFRALRKAIENETLSRACRLGAVRELVYGDWWTVAD
jgi:hypothetical protein